MDEATPNFRKRESINKIREAVKMKGKNPNDLK
jgi:hypothetical protein